MVFDDDVDRPHAGFFDLESADVVFSVIGGVEGGCHLLCAVLRGSRVDLDYGVGDVFTGFALVDLDGRMRLHR